MPQQPGLVPTPLEFDTGTLGVKLWSKQEEVLGSLAEHRRVAVKSGNGLDKGFCAAVALLWFLHSHQDASIALSTAPTFRQVRHILWRQVHRLYRPNAEVLGGKMLDTRWEISDDRYAMGLSAENADQFQGFHSPNMLIVVDEAEGVSDEIYEAIEAVMTAADPLLLLIGNPTTVTGAFRRAFFEERHLYHTITISALDSPNVQAGKTIFPGLTSAKWVDERRETWGEDNPIYRARVLGEFPDQAEDTLISLSDVEAAVQRWAAGEAGADDEGAGGTPEPTPEPTEPPPADAGGAVEEISEIPSDSSLTTDIINDGAEAGSDLESAAVLDPEAAGESFADAADTDPTAAAEALVVAAEINNEIGAVIFTEAALSNAKTVGDALIEAATLDAETITDVVIAAAETDPFATSLAVVEAAKTSRELTVSLLVETGREDPKASGEVWASAGAVDSRLTGELLIGATQLDSEVTGNVLAAAAEANVVTMRNTLVQAARLDAATTGEALVVASEVDAEPISKAILAAAKIDPGVMQATLESGSAGAAEALASLGVEVPVESFVSENPPIEGTDPSTGEVWEVVAPPSASVEVLAKFQRGNPEAAVEVIDVPELPEEIAPLPEGEITANFVQISETNFDQEDLRATHVTFFVPKSWLLENDIHPWGVSFNRYDEDDDSWQAFRGKRVREDENFVYYTATPPGFSLWAVSGRSSVDPVQFRVDDLSINPLEIREFEEVTVQAQVVNLGDTPMGHNATLWLNGRVQATQTVQVPPNSEIPVAFKVFPREGAYEVRMDRQVGHLIVGQAPPPPSSSTVLVLGNASTTRTVTVANPAEGAPLEYVITTDQPWLTANPFTFSLRPGTFQPVTLSVNRTGLEPGSYSGQAVISFSGLISGFSLVTVSMDVSESGVDPVVSPTLNLGPGGISGTTIVSNPLSESSLLYTVTSHVPWLDIAESSFVLAAGASQATTLTGNRGALDIGFHTGLVTISYSGAISGSSVVAVELEVPPPLIPPVVNARLDLGATGTGGIITVSTPPSGGPLEYSVTSNAPWLSASPSNFVLSPGESRPVTLSVDRTGLELGRYAAEVTIAFDGSTSGSSLVPVTIEQAGSAFPTEGEGLETWAIILIGLGGAALLWIIVSRATIRLSGAGTGSMRPAGAPTPLGAGAQLDFGIEAPATLPDGAPVPARKPNREEYSRASTKP